MRIYYINGALSKLNCYELYTWTVASRANLRFKVNLFINRVKSAQKRSWQRHFSTCGIWHVALTKARRFIKFIGFASSTLLYIISVGDDLSDQRQGNPVKFQVMRKLVLAQIIIRCHKWKSHREFWL